MHTFDASSMIYAWENYPIKVFPFLWEWIAERINSGDFTMPEPAYDECRTNAPDCYKWLKGWKLQRHQTNTKIISHSFAIRALLEIDINGYHSDGVGENDIFIISTAKELTLTLVANEAIQSIPPRNMSRYKIPAVCNMAKVGVKCISFLDLLNTLQPDLTKYIKVSTGEINLEPKGTEESE